MEEAPPLPPPPPEPPVNDGDSGGEDLEYGEEPEVEPFLVQMQPLQVCGVLPGSLLLCYSVPPLAITVVECSCDYLQEYA